MTKSEKEIRALSQALWDEQGNVRKDALLPLVLMTRVPETLRDFLAEDLLEMIADLEARGEDRSTIADTIMDELLDPESNVVLG